MVKKIPRLILASVNLCMTKRSDLKSDLKSRLCLVYTHIKIMKPCATRTSTGMRYEDGERSAKERPELFSNEITTRREIPQQQNPRPEPRWLPECNFENKVSEASKFAWWNNRYQIFSFGGPSRESELWMFSHKSFGYANEGGGGAEGVFCVCVDADISTQTHTRTGR